MYVCICHAFNDKQVTRAVMEGARTPGAVHAALGHKVQCGKCVPMVRDMIRNHCGRETGGYCPGTCARSAMPANDVISGIPGIAAE